MNRIDSDSPQVPDPPPLFFLTLRASTSNAMVGRRAEAPTPTRATLAPPGATATATAAAATGIGLHGW